MRGDRVFLSLLKENEFNREIYFTPSFPVNSILNLQEYLHHIPPIDKLNTKEQNKLDIKSYKTEIKKILSHVQKVNKNSQEELNFIDNIRYYILSRITIEIKDENKKESKTLFKLMDEYANDKIYPYQNKKIKEYAEYLRNKT